MVHHVYTKYLEKILNDYEVLNNYEAWETYYY